MNKGVKLLTVGLVVTGLLVVSFAGAALADSPADAEDACPYHHGEQGWGGFQGQGIVLAETVSPLLGLTADEIQAQRDEGKSLAEIAAAQGVSQEALVEAIVAAKSTILQQRVADGFLTQEQADLMLEWMEQRTIQMVNQATCEPSAGLKGSHHGRGMGHDDQGLYPARPGLPV